MSQEENQMAQILQIVQEARQYFQKQIGKMTNFLQSLKKQIRSRLEQFQNKVKQKIQQSKQSSNNSNNKNKASQLSAQTQQSTRATMGGTQCNNENDQQEIPKRSNSQQRIQLLDSSPNQSAIQQQMPKSFYHSKQGQGNPKDIVIKRKQESSRQYQKILLDSNQSSKQLNSQKILNSGNIFGSSNQQFKDNTAFNQLSQIQENKQFLDSQNNQIKNLNQELSNKQKKSLESSSQAYQKSNSTKINNIQQKNDSFQKQDQQNEVTKIILQKNWIQKLPWIEKEEAQLYSFNFCKLSQKMQQNQINLKKINGLFRSFIKQYNKHSSDNNFNNFTLFIKQIRINRQLSIPNMISLFDTEWHTLEKVTIIDNFWFLCLQDLKILQALIRKNGNNDLKIQLQVIFLFPEYIKELAQFKIPQSVELKIRVKNMTQSTWNLLKSTKFNSPKRIKVQLIIKQKTDQFSLQIQIQSIIDIPYRQVVPQQKQQKKISNLQITDLLTKLNQISMLGLEKNKKQLKSYSEQEMTQKKRKDIEKLQKIFYLNQNQQFELRTPEHFKLQKNNLQQLLCNYQWKELGKITFQNQLKQQQWSFFILGRQKYLNLKTIELRKISFELKQKDQNDLKEFANLKYLIIHQDILYQDNKKDQSKAQRLQRFNGRSRFIFELSKNLSKVDVQIKNNDSVQSIKQNYKTFEKFQQKYKYHG